MRGARLLTVAYALPALGAPPADMQRPPPPVFPLIRILPPSPGVRSPLDSVTISTYRVPPRARTTAIAAPAVPLILGGPGPSYVIDLDSRFDSSLVRELPPE
jgi:hypothetical protein